MRKISIVAIIAACLLFGTSIASAQKSKNTMTNVDVIEMVKAGLPENTIVLAIQQSEPNFDTSTKALIELKNQGVSQKILETMLQPQTTKPVPQNRTDNVPPFGQQQQTNNEETSFMEVTLIDGERRILIKRSQPNVTGSSLGAMIPVFGKVKIKSALDGNHAQLRVSDTTPEFEISLPSDVNAAEQLVLVKLNVKSSSREVEVGRGGLTGTSTGFRKEAIIPTTFEEVKTESIGGGMRYTLYRVKVVNPLPPGEYAFVPRGMYYDFGIDSGK